MPWPLHCITLLLPIASLCRSSSPRHANFLSLTCLRAHGNFRAKSALLAAHGDAQSLEILCLRQCR